MLYDLEQVDLNHRDFIWRGLSNPEVYKYYGVRLTNEVELENQMNWYHDLKVSHSGQWWIIYEKLGKEMVGAIGLSDFDPVEQKGELGFWIIPKYWGKRIIEKTLSKFYALIMQDWDIKYLISFVEFDNVKSKKVLLKNGFQYKKLLDRKEFKDNRWIDLEVYEKKLKMDP